MFEFLQVWQFFWVLASSGPGFDRVEVDLVRFFFLRPGLKLVCTCGSGKVGTGSVLQVHVVNKICYVIT
ncbi:hypothetical protein HanXRQr2_Chr17g0811331 [Helianthus annuus]|uniref:Secreted protein n=1 Tax=Helianthus annuus TaxID=4232 RepID=A0A251RRX1_HELAN|nr:hypothetical protein HanXRQr2_Chr17g0811331 [Helianthus annuus]